MTTKVNTLEARQLAEDISGHIRQVREIVELVADQESESGLGDALYGASALCTKANGMCGDLEAALLKLESEKAVTLVQSRKTREGEADHA